MLSKILRRDIRFDGNGTQRNATRRVSYQYRAVEKFWRDFYRLNPSQKGIGSTSMADVQKSNPLHPSFGAHDIHELSAKARHTIYSVVIEAHLRVIFRIDGSWVTTLDVGTHKLYRR